jgi:hypothetical protein
MMWFLRFIWKLFMPDWQRNRTPDPRHSDGRRLCRAYRKRREQVKCFWIVAGLIVLVEPVLPFVVFVSLFTTFLSFMYLDEAGSSTRPSKRL